MIEVDQKLNETKEYSYESIVYVNYKTSYYELEQFRDYISWQGFKFLFIRIVDVDMR